MTNGAISRNAHRRMVWVMCLVVFIYMAINAIGGRALVAIRMAFDTCGGGMCARQWKIGGIVVKNQVRIAGGVAGQAGGAIVRITANAVVFFVGIGIGMAGDAGEFCVIGRIGMAIRTLIPFAFVFAAIYRKMLAVVVESRRHPGIFPVAIGAIGRKIQGYVVGVVGIVVIVGMATRAGIGGVVVIAVVAGGAFVGDHRVGAV